MTIAQEHVGQARDRIQARRSGWRLLSVVVVGLAVGLGGVSNGQAQELVWARQAGGTINDEGFGIAVDRSGNSYVTGLFEATATFGPGEANETTLTSADGDDVFVAKYDSTGALVWAKRAGGTSADQGLGIGVDGSGNSYVTGFFQGTATFGPGEANETTLTSADGDNVFVAKYDSTGALVWAKRAGGTSDRGSGIAVDGSGNSYVTGRFQTTATFGPGEANETTLTSADEDNVFVAKYDGLGNLVWAKRAGGNEGLGIGVDGSGNSYVTGYFEGPATFGPGEANETTLASAEEDVFVAKYDGLGNLVWAKRAGGTGVDQGLGIAVDGSGNSYVTGRFQGTATFGPGEANETTLTGAGPRDVFVAKYDSTGALVWAKRAGGTSFDEGFGIAVDVSGNGYVTGFFTDTATFAPGETNETMLTSAGGDDVFVAKYDSTGALVWAKQAVAGTGGSAVDRGQGIGVDGSGNSYVTGFFNGTAIFGPEEANETTLTSAGEGDIFVAKLGAGSPCASLAPTMGCRVNGRAGQLCQGTAGNDVILGTAGPDVIRGLGGHDLIIAGNGNDTVCGGEGSDAVIGGKGHDDLFGEGGRDALSGGDDNDRLSGGDDRDALSGDKGDDSLNGGADRDACSGGPGTDTAADCEVVAGVP